MPSFNLVDEKWLPVLDLNGNLIELSLREALKDAHLYREIYGETPLTTIALNRFLQALVIRIFEVTDRDEENWFEVWNAKRFDPDKIDEYFDEWKPRFDLFDKERPFYQHREVLVRGATPYKAMLLEAASANNPTLFDHSSDKDNFSFPCSHIPRTLITAQAFALPGGVSKPFNLSGSSLINGTVFWIKENSAFQSILLNSTPNSLDFSGENLRWESDYQIESEERFPDDYADYLTWLSRRYLFKIKNDELSLGKIKHNDFEVFRGMGDKIDGYFEDPLFAFRVKDDEIVPYKFHIDKSLWRDADLLFMKFAKNTGGSPRNLEWIAFNTEKLGFPNNYDFNLAAYGVINDKGKMLQWKLLELPFFPVFLQKPELNIVLKQLINHAEQQSKLLFNALIELGKNLLYPSEDEEERSLSKDEWKEIRTLTATLRVEENYWGRLENDFYQFLDKISRSETAEELDNIRSSWINNIFKSAQDSFDSATSHLNNNAKQLKAIVKAKKRIYKVKP